MKNRELIEDSEELRAAVADLKEKASRAEGVSPDTLSLDSASASLDTASLDMIPEDVEQAAEDAAYTIDEEDDMYNNWFSTVSVSHTGACIGRRIVSYGSSAGIVRFRRL